LPLPVFYEFVALPCGSRVSMPLGVYSWDPGYFRVFRGTRMAGAYAGGPLVLLAPGDPMVFAASMEHRLEEQLRYESGCPVPDPALGAWYLCQGLPVASTPEAEWYSCTNPRWLGGVLGPAYSRAYGCYVELLIILSRARAGVYTGVPEGLLEGLLECVRRSARGGEVVAAAEHAVQAIRGILQGL